jgi:hypothetical protein
MISINFSGIEKAVEAPSTQNGSHIILDVLIT